MCVWACSSSPVQLLSLGYHTTGPCWRCPRCPGSIAAAPPPRYSAPADSPPRPPLPCDYMMGGGPITRGLTTTGQASNDWGRDRGQRLARSRSLGLVRKPRDQTGDFAERWGGVIALAQTNRRCSVAAGCVARLRPPHPKDARSRTEDPLLPPPLSHDTETGRMAKAPSVASSLLAGLNIPEVIKGLRAEYVRSATTQTLVVDLFLVFILTTGLLQVRRARRLALWCLIKPTGFAR